MTPNATGAFGQRWLRFISADDRTVVEIAGEEWFVPAVGYLRGLSTERVLPQNDVRVEATLTDTRR